MDRRTPAGNTRYVPACDHTDAASAPTQGMAATAQGFRDGISHADRPGTWEAPGTRKNSIKKSSKPGIWSPGSVKPNK